MHLLGHATFQAGRVDEALEIMRRAMKIDASRAEYHFNLAGVLAVSGRDSESVEAFRRAVELRPDFANAWLNLGRRLRFLGRLEEAISALRQAVRLSPEAPVAHIELGLALMHHGELLEGWREYEWRWKELKPLFPNPEFARTTWDGSDPAGKRILLYGEGGHGDAIHFVRYAPLLTRRGAKVTLLCHPTMYRLFQTVRDVDKVIPVDHPWGPFDFHCPLLSAPRAFGTTLETIPAKVPYLSADPGLSLRWRRRLLAASAGDKRFNVGLVWSGEPTHADNGLRSVTLEQLAPLAAATSVRFYSLQKGSPGLEARRPPPAMAITDWTGDLKDWADTAALMDNLDLIISVCTSTVHLAGALGKPAWLLSHYPGTWRWMMDRTDSPWYPTLRIFRQKIAGEWSAPIQEMAYALRTAAEKT